MELFSVICTTCKSRLKVRDQAAIGHILACPKCGGMVMIKAPANWSEGSAVRSEQPTVSDVLSASPMQERKLASSAFEAVEDLLSDAPPKLPSSLPPSASTVPARATPSIPLPKQRFAGAPRPTPPPVPAPPAAKSEPVPVAAKPAVPSSSDSGKEPASGDKTSSEPLPPTEGSDTRWRYWLVAGGSTAVGVILTFAAVTAGIYFLRGPSARGPLPKNGTSAGEPIVAAGSPADTTAVKPPEAPNPVENPPADSPPAVAPSAATASENVVPPAAVASAAPAPASDPLGLVTAPMPPASAPVSTESIAKFERLIGEPSGDPLASSSPPSAVSAANAPAADLTPSKPTAVRPAPRDIDLAKRLADPILEIQTSQSPLADFLQDLSDFSTIPITLEPDPLALVKVTADSPVALQAAKTTVGGALTQALTPLKLEHVASGEQLIVRLAEPAALATIEVSAKHLTDGSEQQLQELAELFQALIEPASWAEGSEGGAITVDAGKQTLLVRSRRAVQAQILLAADKLRVARGKSPVLKLDAANFKADSRWKRAQAQLAKPISLNYSQPTRLVTILDRLGEAADVRILVDWREIAALGWNPAGEARLVSEEQPLAATLDALLSPLDLTWRIVDGQTLQVTSPARRGERLELELYAVGDLLKTEQASEELLAKVRAELGEAALRDGGGTGELRFDAPSACLLAALPQPRQRELETLLAKWRAAAPSK